MHRLDDHYGVIDHYGYGKHKGGKGQQVERESEDIEEEECTNQRYWHRDKRNKRRAPVLKEDIYHDKHEDECLTKGLDKVFDRGKEELCHVLHDVEVDAWRHCSFLILEELLDVGSNLCSVGTGGLSHHHGDRRLTIVL